MLVWQGITPCITPRRCRKKPVHYSKRLDRKHHKIETLFSRQKDGRPIATPYDGCAHVFVLVMGLMLGSWAGAAQLGGGQKQEGHDAVGIGPLGPDAPPHVQDRIARGKAPGMDHPKPRQHP